MVLSMPILIDNAHRKFNLIAINISIWILEDIGPAISVHVLNSNIKRGSDNLYKKRIRKLKGRSSIKQSTGKDIALKLLTKDIREKKVISDEAEYIFNYWGNMDSISVKKIDIVTDSPLVVENNDPIKIKFRVGFDILYKHIRTKKYRDFIYNKTLPKNKYPEESNHRTNCVVVYNISIQSINLDFQKKDKNAEVFVNFKINYNANYYDQENI